MKRVVACPGCAPAWRRFEGTRVYASGPETVRLVTGTARSSVRCDECNARIDPGGAAFCVSVSTPRAPYVPWEAAYLRPVEADDEPKPNSPEDLGFGGAA